MGLRQYFKNLKNEKELIEIETLKCQISADDEKIKVLTRENEYLMFSCAGKINDVIDQRAKKIGRLNYLKKKHNVQTN